MALMVCPECGKQVSDQAEACPHCGYPIPKYIAEQKKQQELAAAEAEKAAAEEAAAAAKAEKEKAKAEKKPVSVKKAIIISVVVVALIAGLAAGYIYGFKQPYDAACAAYNSILIEYAAAVEDYNAAEAAFVEKNEAFELEIDELNDLVYADMEPYDMAVEEAAINMIAKARTKKIELPQAPSFRETNAPMEYTVFQTQEVLTEVEAIRIEITGIVAATEQLVVPDYTDIIAEVDAAQLEMENSIQQYQQVTNPSEAFVIERLTGLPGITMIEAATEENDPNGNLHKPGGYTAAVFFIHDQVTDQYVLYSKGDTPVERATDGGGCIEVYATKEDAEARNTYLASFDGGILSSGSHTVCGTIVVRTSNELTATQQKELEAAIIAAFIELR